MKYKSLGILLLLLLLNLLISDVYSLTSLSKNIRFEIKHVSQNKKIKKLKKLFKKIKVKLENEKHLNVELRFQIKQCKFKKHKDYIDK